MTRRKRRAKRTPESYVSKDPVKRAAQRANLRAVPPGPGPGRPPTHRGYAKLTVGELDAKTAKLFDALAADAPLRGRDGGLPREDSVVVRLMADVLCHIDYESEYISRVGWMDEDGNVRPVVDLLSRHRREALEYARELGMTPRSRAALGLDVVRAGAAFDLARHWQEDGDGDDAA